MEDRGLGGIRSDGTLGRPQDAAQLFGWDVDQLHAPIMRAKLELCGQRSFADREMNENPRNLTPKNFSLIVR